MDRGIYLEEVFKWRNTVCNYFYLCCAKSDPEWQCICKILSRVVVYQVMDISEDEMLARRLAMESSREWFDRDHELAVRMAKEYEVDAPRAEPEDSDFYTHLLLQEQMKDLVCDFAVSWQVVGIVVAIIL